jgi:hypothetical protein
MKRDLLLIKKLMLFLEEKENSHHISGSLIRIDDYTSAQINYHIGLLKQGGFVEAIDCSAGSNHSYMVSSLTWDGHTFLDLMKKDTTWNKAKENAKAAGGVALEMLFKSLIEYYAKQIGI